MVERKWGYANATRRRARPLRFALADDPGTGKTIRGVSDRTRHKLRFKDYLGLPAWCNVVNSIYGTAVA